jgi:environmental stress-induced protein Ves
MEQKVYSDSDFVTSDWAGGSTTQLFIYPENATYNDRNFDFRISIAKVDLDESKFTSLPSYDRKLLILDGAISIIHEGHHSGQMKKFDVDSFRGEWITHSFGRCTDFNVMTNASWKSHLFGIQLKAQVVEMIPFGGIEGKLFVYIHKGKIEVETEINSTSLSEGMLMEIDFKSMHELQLKAIEPCELAFAVVEKV